jgi:hypothetical protein
MVANSWPPAETRQRVGGLSPVNVASILAIPCGAVPQDPSLGDTLYRVPPAPARYWTPPSEDWPQRSTETSKVAGCSGSF